MVQALLRSLEEMKKLLLNICLICVCTSVVSAGEPSLMDVIENRAPMKPGKVSTLPIGAGIDSYNPAVGSGAILKAKDGRIMAINGRQKYYSSDMGKTWDEPVIMSQGIYHAMRMLSGAIGGISDNTFYISYDEGDTWQKQGEFNFDILAGSGPYTNTLIQTRKGRLILPMRWTLGESGHRGTYDTHGAWGTLNGKFRPFEGHAHRPEPDNGFVVYSDDLGKTWHRNKGGIMVWHDEGYGGMWPCDEPSIIEAQDGSVCLMFRTTLGRVYRAWSREVEYINTRQEKVHYGIAERFEHPEPTELSGSYSPCAVVRLPKTGHWLIVWNQVSGDEMRAGYARGRISSAISEDDGKTWKHFRTIDTSVLPPAGRVAPDPLAKMTRGLDYVGVLPEDFGSVCYPVIDVVDDTVFVTWIKSIYNNRPGDRMGYPMRVLPLSWFYEDEPEHDLSGPKLYLRIPAYPSTDQYNIYEIPADYYKGRFFCQLKDIGNFLKSPVGRLGYNMYAPLHQVITCLGWLPTYDRSKINDPQNPSMTVTCIQPHAYETAAEVLEPLPNAIRIEAADGGYLELFDIKVGTKKNMVFEVPIDPKGIKKAWLEMLVDDIDEPKEAVIKLNGKVEIKIEGGVIGEGVGNRGRLVVPPGAILKGTNTFEFEFADNLMHGTKGYIINEAILLLEVD